MVTVVETVDLESIETLIGLASLIDAQKLTLFR